MLELNVLIILQEDMVIYLVKLKKLPKEKNNMNYQMELRQITFCFCRMGINLDHFKLNMSQINHLNNQNLYIGILMEKTNCPIKKKQKKQLNNFKRKRTMFIQKEKNNKMNIKKRLLAIQKTMQIYTEET